MLHLGKKAFWTGLVLVIGLCTLTLHPVQSAITDSAITEFPTSGQPLHITLGLDGNLWFTESSAIGRITTGGIVTEFPLLSGSSNPNAITAGPDGNVWFTLPQQNKVGRITSTGVITEISGIQGPMGITTGPDGNLWITQSSDQIAQITMTGVITAFPIAPESYPDAIISGPDGNLWYVITIAYKGGNKIGRITPTGVYTEFNTLTWASGIRDLTTGRDGNIWFTETWPSKIGRITPSGMVTEFELPLTSSGIHEWPGEITLGPDGNFWFTGSQIGRITISGNPSYINGVALSSGPDDITVGLDGNIWLTEYWGQKIGRLHVYWFFFPLVMRR
jgi:streptogramin lyase